MIVDVAVPFRVYQSFHYTLDEASAQSVSEGSVVEVSLGTKKTHAFVVGIHADSNIPREKLKAVSKIIKNEPVFSENMLKLLRWTSEYYCHPLGEVLDAAIPRQQLKPLKRKSSGHKTKELGLAFPHQQTQKPVLTEEQAKAVKEILDPSEVRPFLLHGVTGSGKTEVYLRVLEELLLQGKGAIILVPEIALTPQLLGRFSARFPGKVAVLHSDLTPAQRSHQWEKVFTGEAQIVVGARSAVFAPVKNLGLIVVDEEQEASFKQEDSLRYHARDLAIVRASFEKSKVILGSATPSLESFQNAQMGRYCYLELKKRVNQRPLPKTTFVDIKDPSEWFQKQTSWLSKKLVEKIDTVLKAQQQTILYLNRLGFAHFLFCKDCGHTYRCENCDVALTYYQNPPSLKCHYCGEKHSVPSQCEACQGISLDSLGLGTEQVQKVLQRIFPKARISRMDRGAIKGRKELESVLQEIAEKKVDIIIGTQMVAKGHDFPGIALVGILLADASLNIPDFRANERTFQIITQVSGRAGRAEDPGEVLIQTLNPSHPILQWSANHKTLDFYSSELNSRKMFLFPPFQRIALLRFQHSDPRKVQKYAESLAQWIRIESQRLGQNCHVLGPSEAPISKVKKLYRWQCLLKAPTVKELQTILKRVSAYDAQLKSPVKLSMDVDPLNSL